MTLNAGRIKIALMSEFPDFNVPGFDIVSYNQRFHNSNIIIHAHSLRVGFPEHWGGLSIKCAFGGYEYYESGDDFYAVDASNYLIFNEGRNYSSFIDSKASVESFTINFTPELERLACHTLMSTHIELLDSPDKSAESKFRLEERLKRHDTTISPMVYKLRSLTADWQQNDNCIQEHLLTLLESLISREYAKRNGGFVKAIKPSTRRELVKRISLATDYIEANYKRNISLTELADAACMNSFYFLRQFKEMHGLTPHRFLQQKRMSMAAGMLRDHNRSVVEVCNEVGFVDPVSFGKLFRKYFSQTPGEFRAMWKRKAVRQ